MRYRLIALFSAAVSLLSVFSSQQGRKKPRMRSKGYFLMTDYPAVTLRPGPTSTINLRLQNYGLPPERLAHVGRRRSDRLDRDT